MAFSVKQIKALLSEHNMPVEELEKAAEEICSRHAADLDSIKEQRDTYKKDADAYAKAQKELEELKARPEDKYKEKYEAERKAFESYKAEVDAEKSLNAKKAAYTEICKDAGLNERGIAKAIKYADWNAIELDDDGKVKDGKALMKTVREEWAEHVVRETAQGANTPNPPANNGGTMKTREEIYKRDDKGHFVLDATQRQAALSQLIAVEQQKG